MAWATDLQAVRVAWPDARQLSDDRLRQLLDVAAEQLAEYAPAVQLDANGAPVIPARYVEANVLQAREVYSAARREGGGDLVGFDTYAVRARPLSAAVRQLLRPRRGIPVVG